MVREDAVAAEVLWDLRAVALQAAALMAAALMATKRAEVSRAVAHAGAAVEEARWASGRRRSSPRHGKGTASLWVQFAAGVSHSKMQRKCPAFWCQRLLPAILANFGGCTCGRLPRNVGLNVPPKTKSSLGRAAHSARAARSMSTPSLAAMSSRGSSHDDVPELASIRSVADFLRNHKAKPHKPSLFTNRSQYGNDLAEESNMFGETGDVKLARLRSVVNTACRVTPSPTGKYLNPQGRRCNVERMPLWNRNVWDYGTPTAMALLMRSFLWCAVGLLAVTAVSIPQFVNNSNRNMLRNRCRLLLSTHYGELIENRTESKGPRRRPHKHGISDADVGRRYVRECGYAGLPIRRDIAQLDSSLSYATGTCWEYANSSNTVQHSPFDWGKRFEEMFVASPGSKFCATAPFETAQWATSIFTTLTIIGLLLSMRRSQRLLWMEKHRAIHSAADFAVLLSGLPRGKNDDLETKLLGELQRLGFKAADVVSIVVARDCSRELRVLQRLQSLRIDLDEVRTRASAATKSESGIAALRLQAAVRGHLKRKHTAERELLGADAPPASPSRDKATERQRRAREELQALGKATHETTGHAIVTFQSTKCRTKLLKEYENRLPWWKRLDPRQTPRGSDPNDPEATTQGRRDVAMIGGAKRRLRWSNETGPERSQASPVRDGGTRWSAAIDLAVQKGVAVPLLAGCTAQVAPEPDEVLWQHLELPPDEFRFRMRVSYAVMLVLVLVNVVIIGTVTLVQKHQETSGATALNWYLSALIGIAMTLINYVSFLLVNP